MIDFSLTEEQKLLVDSIRDFAKSELYENLRKIEQNGISPETRAKVQEMGILAVEFPEDVGGLGMDMTTRALVLKTMAEYGDPGATYTIFEYLPFAWALFDLAQDKELIKPVLEGKKKGILAKCGIYPDFVSTRANAKADRNVLAVDDIADFVAFFAKDGEKISLCVADDVKVEREILRSGVLSSKAREVVVEKWDVVKEDVLSDRERWRTFTSRIKLFISALCVGTSRIATEYAIDYALERVAFGKPIAYHQAIGFMLADMKVLCDGAEAMLWRATWKFDRGKTDRHDATTEAFLEAVEVAEKVTADAVQVLGGHGYITDHPVEKWMRDFQDIANCYTSARFWSGSLENMEFSKEEV